jgi:hypothetical protein
MREISLAVLILLNPTNLTLSFPSSARGKAETRSLAWTAACTAGNKQFD